jgi:hypothetical protein
LWLFKQCRDNFQLQPHVLLLLLLLVQAMMTPV